MDEMTMIRELLAAPPPPPPHVTDRAWRRLDKLISRRRAPLRRATLAQPGGRRLALAALGTAAVSAAAVLAIVTLAPTGMPTGPRYQGAGPLGTLNERAARPFLLTMAVKAARSQVKGRYWCTDAITSGLAAIGANGAELTPPGEGLRPSPPSDFRYAIISKSREESCEKPSFGTIGGFYQNLGSRPATQADVAAWHHAGSPDHWLAWYGQIIHLQAGPREATGAKPGQPSFGSYASLPASPAKLRVILLAHPFGIIDHNRKLTVFSSARILLLSPVIPAVRAAAYKVLAAIPGIQMEPNVKDPGGRVGTAVWIRQPGWEYPVIIIDPATGALLADEWLAGKPTWVYKPGTVTQYNQWVSVGWTNQAPPKG
jgi:hypothetical protein